MGQQMGELLSAGMSAIQQGVSTRPLPGPPAVLQAAGGGGHGGEGLVHAGRGGRRCAWEGRGCTRAVGAGALSSRMQQLVRRVLRWVHGVGR